MNNLFTLQQFADKYPKLFTVSKLRWLRFRSKSEVDPDQPLSKCFIKKGGSLYVDEIAMINYFTGNGGDCDEKIR